MNEYIKATGGFSVLTLLVLFIGLIWFDTNLMLKLIGTNIVLIFILLLLDKATE